LRVVSSAIDPDLAKAAVDAVKQWRYQPAQLNGEPVEAVTTVTVNFALAGGIRGQAGAVGTRAETPLSPPPAPVAPPQVALTTPPPPPPPPPQRIRQGGNVQQAMLLSQVKPIYPPDAKEARIQGVVVLEAVVSKEGDVQSVNVISGHPLLQQAAIDAVSQWKYKPTLLNGQPVEVVTTITVNFAFQQ
jgi:protein TonB